MIRFGHALLHCISPVVALSCPERVRRNVRSRRRKQTYEPSAGPRILTLERHGGSELLLHKTDQRPYSARHNFLI